MKKRSSLMFYILGGLLAILLVAYISYLINFLVNQLSVVAQTDLIKKTEIVTFNLEKFEELGFAE